jgi:hypothetical protein
LSHNAAWGGGSQDLTIPNRTLSITVRITGTPSSDPDLRTIVVTDIGAVLPSFLSVALGGAATGANVFALDPDRGGVGVISRTTGEFHVNVYATFRNGVFATSPAYVQLNAFGTFNFNTGTAIIDNFGTTNVVFGESSTDTLW